VTQGEAVLIILDPRAEPGLKLTAYDLTADMRGNGYRIALISNGFPDATNLLQATGAAVHEHRGVISIQLFERSNASVLASLDVISEVRDDYDVAITAIGHCGSCTSSAVRDAVNVARAGVPAVALVTARFLPAAAYVARSVGMPNVPVAELPHPVAGTGTDRIREIGKGIAPRIVELWERL
jgi:hypothetical protein